MEHSHSALRRSPRIALIATVLMAAGWVVLATSSPASATCHAGGGYWYVSGGNSNNTVKSVRTDIQWFDPDDLCGSSTSYSISIVNGSGWLQVGWLKQAGYQSPMGYCEINPQANGSGTYTLTEYSVAHQEQTYAFVKNSEGGFECRIDGVTKKTTSSSIIGFGAGDWVPVQAEAHRRYQQLGRLSPHWLEFTHAEKVLQGGSGWSDMNVQGVSSSDPVWNWNNAGMPHGFKVSTDVSH